MVGMPVTRYDEGVTGFSSTFIFKKVIWSPCLLAISSRIGATCLRGPHHSAQKSTRTGLSDLRTCASNSASVTDSMCPTMGHLSHDGSTPNRVDEPQACFSQPHRGGECSRPTPVGIVTDVRTARKRLRTDQTSVTIPAEERSGAGDLGLLDEHLGVGAGLGLGGVADVGELGEVALRVERGGAAGAGGRDGLA